MCAAVVSAIVCAPSLFERLQLPTKPVERSEIKRRFRQLALEVHPDKCDAPDAKEAFQLIAEAFETLSDPLLQEQELKRLYSKRPISVKRATPKASEWGSWWQVSWTVFEKSFAERERLEQSLRTQFMQTRSSRYTAQKVKHDILQAERTVRSLDECSGIMVHALWPRSAQIIPDDAHEICNVRELSDTEASNRLLDLLMYLRERYHYCLFCGYSFNDPSDLEANCPGPLRNDH